MSLEELRAQVAAEEAETDDTLEIETTEEEEAEADENDQDQPGEEPAESDEFELSIEGDEEPAGPTPEEALIHKFNKQRKRAKQAETEVEALKRQIEELKQSIKPQPTPQTHSAMPTLVLPDLYDPGIDGNREKFNIAVNTAMQKYHTDLAAYNNRHTEASQAQQKQTQRIEAITKKLATSAAKFATENKVNVDRVAEALNTAVDTIDEATGIDGSMAYLLDSVGEGADRVGFYIGTNKGARDKLISILAEDKSGLKAVAYMSRLASQLKPKKQIKLSNAPEPDKPVKGDAVESATAKQLQSMWDKEKDPVKLQKIRKKARELGVKLA